MKQFLELYLHESFIPVSIFLLFCVFSVCIYVIIHTRIKQKLTQIRIDESFDRSVVENDELEIALISSVVSIIISLFVVMSIDLACQSMIDQQKTVISSHTYEQGKDYAFYCDYDFWDELNADIRKIVDRDKFENGIADNDNKLLIEEKVIDNYSENGLSSTNEYPKQSEIDDKYDEVLLNVEDSRENDNDTVTYHALVVKEVEIEYLYKGEELNTKKLVLEVTREVR